MKLKLKYRNFENICKMSQERLKVEVENKLRETHETVISEDGFVYAQGKFPVLLVAHIDTVHDKLPTKIVYDNGKMSSPNGIGGDDRCGIYMILEIIKKYHCSVLFCEDEEIGCVGAEKFTKSTMTDELVGTFNYIIEFDRKGNNDAVFYECDNIDFENFITKEFYKTAHGSFSDICTVAPFLKAAAVNLSCGYYKAHTKDEYIVLEEMETSIKEAMKILARTTDEKFKYIPLDYGYYGNRGWYDEFDLFDDNYFIIEYIDMEGNYNYYETEAISKIEAVGRFCIDNEYICVADIVDIYTERELEARK